MKKILETERLYLREFIPEDAVDFYHLNSDPEVIEYTGDPPFESQEAARLFIKNYDSYERTGIGRYAVVRKEDNEFLGWCGLKYHSDKRAVDLGYRLYRCYWGKGYASESAKGCVEYAFAKARFPHLIAHVHIDNLASQHVLKNCKFSRAAQST